MYPLKRIGQDVVMAALLLLTCLGVGLPAFAATPVNVDPSNAITDFTVNEDAAPNTFDLQSVFRDGSGPYTYAVISNSNSSVVDAATSGSGGRTLTLTYLPNASGSATITVEVTDSNTPTPDTATDTFTVTVLPVNDPPIALAQSVTTAEDTPSGITLTGTDADGDPLTFIVGTAPLHGTLVGSSPTFTYTPALNYNGADSFTFRANDGTVNGAFATVTINVTPVNDAPVATAQAVTTAEDTATVITLGGTDVDGDTLTFVVGTLPSHGTLTGTAPNLTYTPAANYNGPDTFTFHANDGVLNSSDVTVTITVTPVNDAPIATAQAVTTAEDTAKAITLAGTDVDGDTLTFVVGTAPIHGTLTGTAPNLTYTPALNYNGADSFTFKANDGLLNSVDATVTITVTPVNDAPTVSAQAVTTAEDTAKPITLVGADVDGDPLTFIPGAPAHGTLTGASPTFTYTPALNYNGADSFTYHASDGALNSLDATVSITVTPVNDPPVATAQVVTTAEDTAQAITLGGTDVDGDTLTFVVVAAPTHGVLTGTAPNLTYTPALNYNGGDTFTFRANDGTVNGAPAAVTINITPVNDAPVATAQAVTTAEDTATLITLAGTDVDGDTLTFVVGTPPSHGTLTGASPTFTYTPALNYNGGDSFTFKANDGTVSSLDATVTITVTTVNDAPTVVAVPPVTVVNEDSGPVAINLSGMFADVDVGDTLTLSVVSTTGTIFSIVPTISGTTLTVTLGANRNGPGTVTVKATDTSGASVTGPVQISVTPVNDAPTLVNPITDFTAAEDSPPRVFDLSSVFGDVDIASNGDVLTFAVVSNDNPSVINATISGSTLTLTFMTRASGVANISVSATDTAGLSATNNFKVTVSRINYAPIASDDPEFMDEDSGSIDIPVLANDDLGDQPTSIISAGATITINGVAYPDSSESTPTTIKSIDNSDITLPNGTVVVNGNIITYTPKANFYGIDHFSYTIQDVDGQTSTGTVTITVNAVNDPPVQAGSMTYTMVQASSLAIQPAGGLASRGYDVDQDPITVVQDTVPSSIAAGFPGTTLTFPPPPSDGSFVYTPDVTFVGTDTFVIRLSDGIAFSAPITVTIQVTAAPPPPPPAPAGEVEFDLKLANVPLEDAISAEANVLVIMDDSGSMDWSVMTDGSEGEFWLTNAGVKASNKVPTATFDYQYITPLFTNVYGNGQIVPTEEALCGSMAAGQCVAADPAFNGNNYGVWRALNSQYNTVYYNPAIQYKPWVGLDRNSVDFANVDPTKAPLDPFNSVLDPLPLANRMINLTLAAQPAYVSNNVPVIGPNSNGTIATNGQKNLTNSNVYIPRYYTTTVAGRPKWNDPHTLVQIKPAAGAPYVGGPNRADCATDDGDPMTCTFTQEIQNFANWFTYYRSREYMAKASLGRTVADVSNIRLAYVTLNDANERTKISSMNASYRIGNKKTMMDQIYKIDSNNGTPLRDALDKAGKYFECKKGDSFGSGANTTPGNAACPVLPSPQGQCQNNFALLFSDGTWNETFSTGTNGNAANNNDGDCNTQFDCGKYKDNVAATLADVAMYYYERDLQPGLQNGVATTARDTLGAPAGAFGGTGEFMHQHMKTFTVGIGLKGLIDPSTIPASYATAFAWGNPFSGNAPDKVDDMLHAAVNGRGQALQASDPVLLSTALQSAFQEFTNGSVSVSAVAFNSTALREQTVEYRGFFNLKYSTGDLRALNVNATTGVVDEVNPLWRAAPKLDTQTPTNRTIFTYDRLADKGIPFRFANLNANQKIVLDTNELNWVRGDRSQEEPVGAYRQRPLVEGLLGDIVHSAPQFVGAPRGIRRDQSPFPLTKLYSAFKDAHASRTPIVYVAANDGIVHGFDAGLGTETVGYIPNKLIDGSQRFKNALDQLTTLTYTHHFFVDVTPTLEDVYMPPKKASVAKDWTTVMVGGLGGGGKGYYALNVSEPATDFTSETNASSTVLWEFTDKDDTYPVDSTGTPLGGAVGALTDLGGDPIKDLGYTYSPAQIAMSNVNDTSTPVQKKWVAIFGNGYNSSSGFAKLFVVPIENGLDGWQAGDVYKLDTGEGTRVAPDVLAGYPNGLGTPTLVDVDLNGTADLAYAGDTFGNLYRFNISSTNPSLWTVTKLFQATYTSGATTTRQPITTQPYVIKNPAGGFVVIFGTGSYITDTDGVSTQIQSTYGIWDRGEINPATANSNTKATRLVQQVVTNVVDQTNTTFNHLRFVSANPVPYTPQVGANPGVYGWYFDFVMQRPSLTLQGNANPDIEGNAPPAIQYPGERAIRRFVPRGSALLVTTVIPRDANTCLRSPPGSTFPIDALTGGNPTKAVLDLNNDGIVDSSDFLTVGGVQYAAGILFDTSDLNGQLVDPSLLLGNGGADFLFLSGGDEQITIRVAGAEDPKTGRLSWRELDDAN